MKASRSDILRDLALRIQEIETQTATTSAGCVLRIPGLKDQLAAGSLVELLAHANGAGVWSLALFLSKQILGERRGLVVVDSEGSFYPPAAVGMGIRLSRLIVIRPRQPGDAIAVCQEALRCPAVAAVIGWHRRLRVREARQLQLAAEAGRGVGFLLRPEQARAETSFAATRLLLTPLASTGRQRRLRLDVLRCRGGKQGQSLMLEMDDETSDVHLPADVASATPGARATPASG